MRQLSVTIVTNREVVNYTLSSKTKTRAKIKTAITNKPRPQTKQMTTKKRAKVAQKSMFFNVGKYIYVFKRFIVQFLTYILYFIKIDFMSYHYTSHNSQVLELTVVF